MPDEPSTPEICDRPLCSCISALIGAGHGRYYMNKADTIRLAAAPKLLSARPTMVFIRVQVEPSARLPADLVPPGRQQLVRAQVRLPSLGIIIEANRSGVVRGLGRTGC